jgi:cytochrome c oxidase subunit 2
MEQADYEKWLQEGSRQPTLATLGGRLFRKHGCSGCHGASSRIRAPALEGIYGSMIPIQVPTGREPLEKTPAKMIRADDRYIHDAIVLPEKEVAAGYAPIMPTYKNRLTEEEVFQLTAYIKSLATVREKEPSRPGPGTTEPLSADEYRARTGFSPENLLELQRLAEPQPGGARRRQ